MPGAATGKEIFRARVRACLCFSSSSVSFSILRTGARLILETQRAEASFTYGSVFSHTYQLLAGSSRHPPTSGAKWACRCILKCVKPRSAMSASEAQNNAWCSEDVAFLDLAVMAIVLYTFFNCP